MIPCPGQAVIFDFDGVVVDSRSAWRIYFDRLRAELGLGPMSDADLEFMFIHTTREAVERLFPPTSWTWPGRRSTKSTWPRSRP